ncbi:MAG: hypothetical protein ACLS7B_00850 [Hominilimicola sp.]
MDEEKLASDEYQSKIAWAIASAQRIIQSDVKIKRNYAKFYRVWSICIDGILIYNNMYIIYIGG